jgi:hypothetical protein
LFRVGVDIGGSHLWLDTNRVLYLRGDVHHYERQAVGDSLHVITGGGGAFLHGSRIAPDAGSAPPVVVRQPNCRWLIFRAGLPRRSSRPRPLEPGPAGGRLIVTASQSPWEDISTEQLGEDIPLDQQHPTSEHLTKSKSGRSL